MGLLSRSSGLTRWRCDSCKWDGYSFGTALPALWESRSESTFCRACVALFDRNNQPRETTSCVECGGAAPAGQDKGSASSPSGPRRERVAVSILLAFAAATFVIALAIVRRVIR